jgi:ribosomal protein L29
MKAADIRVKTPDELKDQLADLKKLRTTRDDEKGEIKRLENERRKL